MLTEERKVGPVGYLRSERSLGAWAFVGTKRAFDILVALIGLVPCVPVFLVVAVLIKLDSKGSVFFTYLA